MTKETMTIHEALTEMKLIDKRILNKINAIKLCYANKHANMTIGGKTLQEVSDNIRADWKSVTDLIARRAAIRNAVAKSNGTTLVEIAGRQYTVSEAIEMRDRGVLMLRHLLDEMREQEEEARTDAIRHNDSLNEAADRYVTGLFGSREKANVADINAAKEAFISANTYDVIDPLNLKERIEKLNADIDTFTREVNSRLSVSNALTTVTFEY